MKPLAPVIRTRLEGEATPVSPQVGFHHQPAEFVQGGGRGPAQMVAGFLGVAAKHVHLAGPVVFWIDPHPDLAGAGVAAQFAVLAALPFELHADGLKSHLHEVPDRPSLVGGQHVGIRLGVLEHPVHPLYVFLGVAPVALGVQIAQFQHLLLTQVDFGDSVGDFAGHEFLAAQRGFVVEQDAATGEQAVGFAVVDRGPVGEQLGDAVGATRVKERGLGLRHFVNLAVHFRGGCLVEANFGIDDANRFQQMQDAQAGDVGGGHRLLERNADEALRGEVINFVGLSLLQDAHTGTGVSQVVFD